MVAMEIGKGDAALMESAYSSASAAKEDEVAYTESVGDHDSNGIPKCLKRVSSYSATGITIPEISGSFPICQ